MDSLTFAVFPVISSWALPFGILISLPHSECLVFIFIFDKLGEFESLIDQ